ncbi:hypothetical protein BH11ARM2_BH11ARM2_25490 [soil metagenome]
MAIDPFKVRLAQLDSLLQPNLTKARERLEYERDELRLRLQAARAVGVAALIPELEREVASREEALTGLDVYLNRVAAPKSPPAPAPAAPQVVAKSNGSVVPASRPIVAKLPVVPPPAAVTAPPVDFVQAVEALSPKPSPNRTRIKKSISTFLQKEREFTSQPAEWTPEREATLKSLVCEGRGIAEEALQADMDGYHVLESVRMIRDEWNEKTEASPFFAFNETRHHRPEIWQELSEAFASLGEAESALDFVAANELAKEDREELILRAGAAEAWIHRLADDEGLGFIDGQQRRVHRRVEEAAGEELFIPWWNADRRPQRETLAKEAGSLSRRVEEIKRKNEAAAGRADAMDALKQAIASIEEEGDVEETLVPAVRKCLDAGVRPSDKNLVALCQPYRAVFRVQEDKIFDRLNEYLSKTEALLLRKGAPADRDEEVEEDPEFNRKKEAVMEHLKGKTVLFVGGRRIPEKQREIERELGFKLEWPDAEPDTLLHDFIRPAEKSDVVCFLIRWSRHSYKAVIDHARTIGKQTVVIKAGVGVNRLVHDMYHQLIERPLAVASASN